MTAIPSIEKMIEKSFGNLDSDHDGYLDEADLKRYSDELINKFGRSPDEAAAGNFRAAVQGMWRHMQGAMDKNQGQRISKQEFTEYQLNQASTEVDTFAEAIFDLANADDNNHLSREEFRNVLAVEGQKDPKFVDEVFERYDSDNDGSLTKSEYRKYVQEHMR
ncbi:EF-hand domain-containing protein [Saccharopolyspora shandongensis]|uniref:EF-hand domain-containing protein n=1 Tax=Saccharopolyspora shandongensis TaxID=418495 RepID=UPI00342DF2DB